MKTSNRAVWLAPPLLVLVLVLVGCARQESAREIDWAKSALSRNPQFEIVATDESAGVFTVRDTGTGEVRTLRLQELIAAPPPPRETPSPTPAVSEPSSEPAAPEDGTLAADQTTPSIELPGVGAEPPASGALAEGPGYRITRGAGEPEAAAAPATLEGPGYRIEREGNTGASADTASGPASTETRLATAERRTDPIICQGYRQMHIDGEVMEFAGDAVIAEKGCDLYITNARIRAGGVGIIARQQGRVHIVNSTIGGTRGSYEASAGGEIYVTRSTFEGVGRRFEGGQMTDLGGNRYSSR
jgi:hypothetical protein